MIPLTLEQVARATGGALGGGADPAAVVRGISTDTRAVALLAGVPSATTADLPNRSAIDWAAPGPYPTRTKAEALKLCEPVAVAPTRKSAWRDDAAMLAWLSSL